MKRPLTTTAWTAARTQSSLAFIALLLCCASLLSAQRHEVWGVITDESGQVVEGAVVKLSNRLTLAIQSFITQADGEYRFRGLNPRIDYTVRAQKSGVRTNPKRLSYFESSPVVRADILIKKQRVPLNKRPRGSGQEKPKKEDKP